MKLLINLQFESHRAVAECESGETIPLSYSGFHGRTVLECYGLVGINALLADTEQAMWRKASGRILKDFFAAVGAENGIRLISVMCPDSFKAHWIDCAGYQYTTGQGYSFRKVLELTTGTKSTLSHLSEHPYVQELRELCENIESMKYPVSIPSLAHRDGISVAFIRARNNLRVFSVNGTQVSVCSNRAGALVTEYDVLDAAQAIQEAVRCDESVETFTSSWGGSFVLRVIAAVCKDEAIGYFRHIAHDFVAQRREIDPRKILKGLNFSCNDKDNRAFTDKILETLEFARNESADMLIEGNETEMSSDNDFWTLFFMEAGMLRLRRLDFQAIKSEELRKEAREFLRDRASFDEPVTQLARYFYLIRDALHIIADSNLSSMSSLNNAHVSRIESVMVREKKSTSKVAETMQVMGRFYEWARYGLDSARWTSNPFYQHQSIRNMRRFTNMVKPADHEAMELAADHFDEFPEHIQLALLLHLSTLARANDIFKIRLSDIRELPDGSGEYRFVMGKTGRWNKVMISPSLMERIACYAEKTERLREEYGDDSLLLYDEPGCRCGSKRKPMILNASAFRYSINKVLSQYTDKPLTLTPRSIRAEGGRRLHMSGKATAEIGAILGNRPIIAAKHYRNLSASDQAALFHAALEKVAQAIWCEDGSSENTPESTTTVYHPMFGTCCSQKACSPMKSCDRCGFLNVKEGGSTPWALQQGN